MSPERPNPDDSRGRERPDRAEAVERERPDRDDAVGRWSGRTRRSTTGSRPVLGGRYDRSTLYRYAAAQALLLGSLLGLVFRMTWVHPVNFSAAMFGPVALAVSRYFPVLLLLVGSVLAGLLVWRLLVSGTTRHRTDPTVPVVLAVVLVGGVAIGGVGGGIPGGTAVQQAGIVERYQYQPLAATFEFDYDPRGDGRGILHVRMTSGDTLSGGSVGDGSVLVAGRGFANVPGATLNESGNWVAFDRENGSRSLTAGDTTTVGVTEDCSIDVIVQQRHTEVEDRLGHYECPGS